ncbi:MAG: phosphate acyltransferase PlsX [Clostridia bacterium]|nr:phosphate acyltransferase PlsX [Clostridia bacterium]
MKTYTVALDVMGSDKGPMTVLGGAKAALEKHADLKLLLVGDQATVEQGVRALSLPEDRIEILPASQVITNYDSPATALFEKKDSSLVLALSAASAREDIVGVVNAGSTGALIAGSLRYLSRQDRVRPALAVTFPAEAGGYVCLVDAGATVDCTSSTLLHFARLGTEFAKDMYRIESPRVGLLSNGAEETKGNALTKETHALLKEATDINFIGNVEGSNALSGVCDVLVCDGFAGNQVLKVTEGTMKRILTDIVKIAKTQGKQEYLPLVGELMRAYGVDTLGGGIILGAKKPVVKAHGAADESAIVTALGMVLNLAKNKA